MQLKYTLEVSSICSANYCQILNEHDTMYDMSMNDIGNPWKAGLSNATTANINVLSEMTDIRNGFKRRCKILYYDDINSNIMNIAISPRGIPLPF